MYKEVRGLHQAAYVLAIFAFGSQLLALLRDRLLAHEFGAGAELDIYYAAFRIPDLLFVLFASTLSVYVLIPFVTKLKEGENKAAARNLLSEVFSLFLIVYALVAAVLFLTAPWFLDRLFPGIQDQEMLVNLTRVLLLQPLFLGISSLFGVVTQLGHRFVLYAVSPLIYNLGIIFGILVLFPIFGLSGLAMGVVLGAVGHMAVQLPLVAKSNLKVAFRLRFRWPLLREVLSLSLPRAFTLSLNQIVLLVLISLASTMAVGSVSVFQFAHNLQSVPLAIIGVSYSVAAFPTLAAMYSRQEYQQFAAHLTTAMRHVIFWAVPAMALIIVLRAQIVRVVLGSGAFDWADTRLTAAVLALLSLALLAQAINLLVIRAFYAGGYTKTPFYVALGGSILAIFSAYGFYTIYQAHTDIHAVVSTFMRLENVIGSEVLAVAFGYALAISLQAIVLVAMLAYTFKINMHWLASSLTHALAAALVGGTFAYGTLNFVVEGVDQNTFIGIFIQGLLAGLAGLAGVVATYAIFKSPALYEVYNSFQRKLFKTDVIAPQKEVI